MSRMGFFNEDWIIYFQSSINDAMLGWNKQFLLKKRSYSISQPFPRKEANSESQLALDIQAVISHLKKMLLTFLTLKFRPDNLENAPQTETVKPFEVPTTFSQGDQRKTMKILYRRIQNILLTFGRQAGIGPAIQKYYENQLEEQTPSAQDFFQDVQSLMLAEILNMRKKKGRCPAYRKTSEAEIQKQLKKKVSMRDLQNEMRKTIYSVMDLCSIDGLYYFIEGVDINDNISLLYDRQRPRNCKIKKQIKEYAQSYQNRTHVKDGYSRVKPVHRKQKQNIGVHDDIKVYSRSFINPVKEKKSKSSLGPRNRIALKPLTTNVKNKLKLNR